MKDQSTLFFSQLRYSSYRKSMLIRSGEHTLLRKAKNINPERSYLNNYYLNSNLVDAKTANDYLVSRLSPPQKNSKSQLSERRSKLKLKFKKWSSGKKTSTEEIRLFKKIVECLDNNKPIPKAAFHLDSIEGKISRYNDKKKAVLELEKLQDELVKNGISRSGYTIHTVEKLIKIPEDSTANMSVKEQTKLYSDYHNKFFSDFPVFLIAEHHDELREHPHFYHEGISPDDQLYADREIELLISQRPDLALSSCQYNKLTDSERSKAGRAMQEHFYKYANSWLVSNQYDFEFIFRDIDNTDPKEQQIRREMRQDNKKPIGERLYNQNTYLAEKNKALEKVNARLKAGLEAGEKYLLALTNNLTELVQEYRQKALNAYVKATLEANSKRVAKRSLAEIKEIDIAASPLDGNIPLSSEFKQKIRNSRTQKAR